MSGYGDATLIIVRSIGKNNGVFNFKSYVEDWKAFWDNPDVKTYKDGASKTTHANLISGANITEAGSNSADFNAVGRTAALFGANWENSEDLVSAARQLCSFTHNNQQVIEATEFFTRVVL